MLICDPYWWEDATPEAAPPPTSLPARVDVAIVGAGFTGLSAACELAAGGREVLVLDALAQGMGASTRNGGMVGSGIRLEWSELVQRFGCDRAERILRESMDAVDHLEAGIARHGIDCDFRRTGRTLAAWRSRDMDLLRRRADDINRLREGEAEVLSADRLFAEEVASPRYHGGLVLRSHGAVQPAKLHAGLLARARELGAQFAFHSAVLGIDSGGSSCELRLRQGVLRAAEVIVATNGYTGRHLGWFAKRLLPIPSFIIASAPLPPERLARMLPRDRMIVETRSRHCYYRRSHDGRRLLLGGRASLMNIAPSAAASVLARLVADLFPDESLEYTHCWSGFVAFTGSLLPVLERQGNTTHVGGYCGSGIALSNYLGRKAALRILGAPEGETVFAEIASRTPVAAQLPRGVMRLAADALLRARDFAEGR